MNTKSDLKVLEALEKEEDNLIRLSTGVVLCGKAAPALILIKVMAAFPRPKPPIYMNETMGREVENPDDPEYQERVQANNIEASNAMLNTLIIAGTELVEVPKGFPKPQDLSWVEEYENLGLPMKVKNRSWRYLNWVMFKAAPTKEDLDAIQKVVGRLSGVPESAVRSAEDFPGRDEKDR